MKAIDLFKALSDETRFRIVCSLLEGELCACKIPKIVGKAQPTVSLQLKKLVRLGVLKKRRQGKFVHYSIKDRLVVDILTLVLGSQKHQIKFMKKKQCFQGGW